MTIDINDYLPDALKEEIRKSFLGQFLYTPKATPPHPGNSKGNDQMSFCTSETSELSLSDHQIEKDSNQAIGLAEQRRAKRHSERTTPASARRHNRSSRSGRSLSMIQKDKFAKNENAGGEQKEDVVTLLSFANLTEDDSTMMDDKGWNLRVDCLLPDDFSTPCQQRTKRPPDILGNSVRSNNESKSSKSISQSEHGSSRHGSSAVSLPSHNNTHSSRRQRLRRSTTHDARPCRAGMGTGSHHSTSKRSTSRRPSVACNPRWSSMTKLETIDASPRRTSDSIPKAPSRRSHRQDSRGSLVADNANNVPLVIMMPPICNEENKIQEKIAWRRNSPTFRREPSSSDKKKRSSSRTMTGIQTIIENVDKGQEKRNAKRSSVRTNRHNSQRDSWDSFGSLGQGESETKILVSMAW